MGLSQLQHEDSVVEAGGPEEGAFIFCWDDLGRH